MSKMRIDKNVSRLELYQSHYEKDERTGDSIIVTFEWANLDNLVEFGINDPVILGETKLVLYGAKNEKLKAYRENGYRNQPDFFQDLGREWNEVANVEIDEQKKMVHLNGLFAKKGQFYWVEWTAEYETCSVEWEAFVTKAELESGLLPSDKHRKNPQV